MSDVVLEIERSTGVERRSVRDMGDGTGEATGACPGCGAVPFRIQCHQPEPWDDRSARAGARCTACGDPVGWAYAPRPTLFGAEEDRAVLVHGRARVY